MMASRGSTVIVLGAYAPSLILFGENDKVVPPENAALLARQLPKCAVVIG